MDVDIIALQEIWSDEALNGFENLKNKLDGWDGYRKSSGLAYLYKTEIVLNNLSEINELNDIIRTPYLLSINFNGQNIFIINNHFKCCGDGILDFNNESDEEIIDIAGLPHIQKHAYYNPGNSAVTESM